VLVHVSRVACVRQSALYKAQKVEYKPQISPVQIAIVNVAEGGEVPVPPVHASFPQGRSTMPPENAHTGTPLRM
jgi:hypothetical protein